MENWPLYISLPRTADLLGVPVAAINRWRDDSAHDFPRRYNFDRPAEHGRPAIKRGPFFRHDEIQRWKESAVLASCGDPPDKRKTAAPAGTGHGGKAEFRNDNANATGARKQGAPDHFLNGGRVA